MAASTEEFTTIIGKDANFKGELSFEGGAKLLGRFEGSIDSKGKLHIADGSNCKATVTAKEVSVEGHIEGNVEAGDRVEIMANGVITGDVVASRMNMAEGASLNGYCRIGSTGSSNGKAASSDSSTASTTEVKPSAGSSTASSSSSSSGNKAPAKATAKA